MHTKNSLLTKFLLASGLISAQIMIPVGAQNVEPPKLEHEEIIVTATRREQSIQDISGVVQNLDADQLIKDGITDFRQLQIAVPGLSIANQEGNVEVFIRGVGSANNTELGDPAIASHINGIYIPRPRGLGSQFYDLDRVEINKGPQGTLYGRNALGGTINLITKRPTPGENDGYFSSEVLSRGGWTIEAANTFTINDNSALRVAGYTKERDFGFNNAGTEGLDPAGLEEDSGFRLTYFNQLNDRSELQIVADYGDQGGTGYPGANIQSAVQDSGLTADDLDLRDVRYRGQQGESENKTGGIQLTYKYDFDAFTLEYNGSFRTLDFEQRNAGSDGIDFPGVEDLNEDDFSTTFWNTTSDAFVNEIRLASNGDGPLQWSAGLFNLTEEQEIFFFALQDAGFCCFSGVEFTFPEVEVDSTAIYGDFTFDVSDSFRAFGGLRYTDESKSRQGFGGNWALVLGTDGFGCCFGTRLGTEGFEPAGLSRPNFDVSGIDTVQEQAQFLIEGIATPGARDTLIDQIESVALGLNTNGTCFERDDIDNGFATCPGNGEFSFLNLTTPAEQIGEADFNYLDWRIGIEYDVSPSHLLYAKISSGTKSGGFNDSFDGLVPETFDPEELIAYEIGSRLQFQAFGNPATFNATAFYYDYSDQVFQDLTCINEDPIDGDCNGFALVNRNVGSSEVLGLELESHFNFNNGISLDLFATFLNSEIKEGVVADPREQDFGNGGITPSIDLSGNRLPLQSNVEVAARLSQQIALGNGALDWQILAKFRSSYFLSQFNEDNLNALDGSTRTALEIGQLSKQEGTTTINVGLGYSFGGDANNKYRVELYGQNITDEVISQKSIVGADLDLRFLNDARTVGLRAQINF